MITEVPLAGEDDVAHRAALHRALGDETRLRIVDALQLSDRSPGELRDRLGLPTNLLAFHLKALEGAGLVARTASQGDARRRYVTLRRDRLAALAPPPSLVVPAEHVVFVCTANSARSQLAAHMWRARTGRPALSAGTDPAPRVHPGAVAIARAWGLDLEHVTPRSCRALDTAPDLVVSVCDRAHESAIDFQAPLLHWSVPDPVEASVAGAGDEAFARAATEIDERVRRLAAATGIQPELEPEARS